MAEKIKKEELTLLKHTKSLLKSTTFDCDAYVLATSECGYVPYALCLKFCHPVVKNRYAQIISGFILEGWSHYWLDPSGKLCMMELNK